MSDLGFTALVIGTLVLLVLMGMHIAVALMTVAFVGIWAIRDNFDLALQMMYMSAYGGISSYIFATIPLFVLMGLLVSISNIGKDTFDVAETLLRRVAGGLGVATVAANTVFAAVTGVSIASAAVFTKVAVPEMARHGYRKAFAAGTVAGSSVLGMLVPPSLLLIVYGVLAEESIGKLFIAGLIPGVILAVGFVAMIMLLALFAPRFVFDVERLRELGDARRIQPLLTGKQMAGKSLPIITLVLLVLGGLYSGFFTPTEAGGMGAFGAFVIALLRRSLTPKRMWQVLRETGGVSISILILLAGVGALAWHYAMIHGREAPPEVPAIDPLHNLKPTPSMKATVKYFWVVVALFGLQVVLGGITAHYAVEGQGFYGLNLSEVLPYVITRTWHTQLAVLWIATAWLATGLYIAPAISGHEPKYQKLGVNFLFVCLLIIVAGSMIGQWLGVMQKLGLDINFWFGHQGWEYVDLGRFWQIFLFIGLMLWLTLVGRALWPALQKKDEGRPLVILLFLSTVAIGLFYGAGLMWGKHTHLAIVEYWRWWVVHLWVEGFFEVFATAVIAFLFTKLGLVRTTSAVTAVLFATIVFLTGGVLGTFHHLYFTGTPTAVLAIGAAFSALEVVPLVLIGFEAYENWKASQYRGWVATYKWPIMFFISVAFWNLVGAGLLGFLINPPLALYYMQGLNTTPLHGHTALFGVYGMLGIGLMLFCLRGLTYRQVWNEKLLKLSFWSLNLGLAAMAVFSLLPLGLMQVWASVTEGFWYARSAEFLQQPLMQALVWLRVPGDVIFSVGVVALAWFVFRLFVGPRETVPLKSRSGVVEAAD